MGFSPWAIRNLLNNHQRVTQQGLKVYLRVQNAVLPDNNSGNYEYATYGFQLSATGSLTGFQDIEITPPPDVTALSLHNIGLNAGELNFGAHTFVISHTWVAERMNQLGLTDPYDVFQASTTIGLIYNGRLFAPEDIQCSAMNDEIISWQLTCNQVQNIVSPTL